MLIYLLVGCYLSFLFDWYVYDNVDCRVISAIAIHTAYDRNIGQPIMEKILGVFLWYCITHGA